MKKLLFKGIFLAGLTYFISSCNSDSSSSTGSSDTSAMGSDTSGSTMTATAKPSEDDTKFVMEAADGGMAEVELGKLALNKATSAMVKQHAQMMVDDHGKANGELKTLAASKNITLPDSVCADCKKAYDNLAKKKGSDFDKAYTDMMVDDHKKDIGKFKDEASKGTDNDLKTWAAGKLPTLEQHLQGWQMTKDGGKMKMTKDTTKK
ncbi:MAG: DUF4142 domain-containing protein [Ferruginibacter sp.]